MPTMDFDGQVERTLTNITNSIQIHPANVERIHAYRRHMVLSDISAARQQKLMAHLKIIAEQVGQRRFEDLGKEDIEDLVAWLYTRGTADSTVIDYKQVIKQFWKWMNGGEAPPETEWIRQGRSLYQRLLPHQLLTPHDVQQLIGTRPNNRDQAFIATLWETGARIGELIDLTVGDIEIAPSGIQLIVEGKTGARRIRLLEAVPYLERWLAEHPNPKPTVPLWCKVDLRQGTPDEAIGYQYLRLKILEKARENAGIQKPVNPHHFRHSRATYLANYLTEAQMCEWFGWVRGSRVPGRYVHLSGRDIDRAHRAMLDNPDYQRLSG